MPSFHFCQRRLYPTFRHFAQSTLPLWFGRCWCLIALGCYTASAHAFGVLLHYQGEAGDREAYFADVRTISNRTSSEQMKEKTEVREIEITAVYEHPSKPEFVHMNLQFACPAAFSIDMKSYKLTENPTKIKAGDPVTFKLGARSYTLRRADLSPEPIPVSDWKTSSASMLSKAGAIACNHIEFDQALHAAIHDSEFDMEAFYERISKLGLSSEMPLLGQTLSPEFLDFAWSQLWHNTVTAGRRPDPSGKWAKKVTQAEKLAALRKLDETQKKIQPDVEAATQNLMNEIRKSQAERSARAQQATRPDGKKMTPIESNLLILWRGRPESEVIQVMGNPEFNQAGESRFLRYTKYWEKSGLTAYNGRGEVIGGEVGGYAECFVEFQTRQDVRNEWLVSDILVRSNYEDAGLGRTKDLCQDLANAARRTPNTNTGKAS